MFLSLLISLSAFACKSENLAPLILSPTKNYEIEVDRQQEIILDGGTKLPKITGIKGATPKGKPMLTVVSGLQVLEKGQMKSYPHRISIKLHESEKDWERPVEVSFSDNEKAFSMNLKWVQAKSGCAKPLVQTPKK